MRLTAEGRVEDLSFLRELKKPAQGRVFVAGRLGDPHSSDPCSRRGGKGGVHSCSSTWYRVGGPLEPQEGQVPTKGRPPEPPYC